MGIIQETHKGEIIRTETTWPPGGNVSLFVDLDRDPTNDTQKLREILAEATETAYFSP